VRRLAAFLLVAALLALAGCGFGPRPDYGAYRGHMPRSIVVLPPLNKTADVELSSKFMATFTRPLAEQGYYVFPVAVVDRMMKANGLPTPGEMHAVPLAKLGQILGADAVMYITITACDEPSLLSHLVKKNPLTGVAMHYRLVDVKTRTVLWERGVVARSEHGPVPAVRIANEMAFLNPKTGLLFGPRHPRFGKK
jgi:hypothetical protein